jgi:hypothetical protein
MTQNVTMPRKWDAPSFVPTGVYTLEGELVSLMAVPWN